jgi:hypothetical protein
MTATRRPRLYCPESETYYFGYIQPLGDGSEFGHTVYCYLEGRTAPQQQSIITDRLDGETYRVISATPVRHNRRVLYHELTLEPLTFL